MTTADIGKPPGSSWTDHQWSAVVTGGSNVLVAAAAGSGKTAVLVERIIRRISSDTDVDRLLVATFTKAAAAEMKDRIRLALEKELERKPDSEHLSRQLALMGRASITTLHSFCLDVIRKYYPLIGLDPGFRIANETESELLRLEVLDDLFENRYQLSDDERDEAAPGGAGPFLKLVDRYGGEKGDEPLYQLVQELYDFSRSHPWPDHWLRNAAAAFCIGSADELERSAWTASLRDGVELTLEGAAALLRQALELAERPAGPAAYAATLKDDVLAVEGLLGAVRHRPWREWAAAFAEAGFGKLKPVKGDDVDKALQENAKELRDEAKQLVAGLAAELFSRDADQYAEEMNELAPLMAALAELVIEFGARYEEKKRAKGLLDFGDLEHYCLRILRDGASSPGKLIPSVAAKEYQRQFEEILLDEYQDTNMVQEAIVSLIERRSGGGNRFMVGDVKQSIYRFRLAEPNLFLQKYKSYRSRTEPSALPGGEAGVRIDLARNFRSRSEVVDGVNRVFRAIMREKVAELDYDSRAELVYGASYPPPAQPGSCDIQFAVLDRGAAPGGAGEDAAASSDGQDDGEAAERLAAAEAAAEMAAAQLEARWIAARLRELADSGYQVYDGKAGTYRPMKWQDAVILLRASQQWAPVLIEELQAQGIPAYAELAGGYFEATEIETMLSLLRVIDNPYQDIPLAAALRSPLFGLNAEELALIRIYAGNKSYYEAAAAAAGDSRMSGSARNKLSRFLDSLDAWREEARQGSLADLLWRIYKETGYYDFAGGLPGGMQRQANLRALYDRAKQYEATSFRGLFRFLRFIERMRDSGGDLGTAGALGEGEDVVRIMSIHKSKGLEFPVVFAAGLGKSFNMQDLRRPFLLHKELGFGPKFVDPDMRISFPSLPCLAIRRAMRNELLAEEMRILYVALTRPKEKLFLVGTASNAAKKLKSWQSALEADGSVGDYHVASAKCFLDWLGPLAASQLASQTETREVGDGGLPWSCGIAPAEWFGSEAAASLESPSGSEEADAERLQAIVSLAVLDDAEPNAALGERLSWTYPYAAAAETAAKTSVTEMKRLAAEPQDDAAEPFAAAGRLADRTSTASEWPAKGTFRLRRPAFMEEKTLTPAEKGSVSHLLMQHLPLDRPMDEAAVRAVLDDMTARKLLTPFQAASADAGAAAAFYNSELGLRLLRASWVRREVPFSSMFPAGRIYPEAAAQLDGEGVLIQGVIDCLFQDERGLVLLDYKTDRIYMQQWEQAAERHRFQIELYAEAVESALGRKVDERYVYFFDGAQAVKL